MLVLTASGDADPALAWERYARPARWPHWAPHIRSVDYPHRALTAGASGVVHGPFGVALDFTVAAVDPTARTWSWRVGVGPVRVRLHHCVEAAPGGSRTRLAVHAPRLLVAPYAPVALWALRRLVAA